MSLQRLEECKVLKCLRGILEMRGSAVLYVTTNGTISLQSLGLVCNALVREILTARRNCSRTDLTSTDMQSTKQTLNLNPGLFLNTFSLTLIILILTCS